MIEARFEYFKPNRRFLGALMTHAADPSNPLSPFAAPSKDIRDGEFANITRALRETKTSVPKDLEAHMPKILWIYMMGLLLFWIYDNSRNQQRTHALVDKSLGLVTGLLKLSNVPLLRPVRRTVQEIVGIVERS
jgi:hypothetical protein